MWVRASRETCLARNDDREGPISKRGVHAMFAEFELPRADLTLDTDELSVESSLDELERVLLEWIDGCVDAVDR